MPQPSRNVPWIELFQNESSSDSHQVRSCLMDLNLDYIALNVADGNQDKRRQLLEAGGKDQIPFLVDHQTGVRLYESQAIINYLKERYSKEPPPKQSRIITMGERIQSGIRSQANRWAWNLRMPLERAGMLREELEGAWTAVKTGLNSAKDVFSKAAKWKPGSTATQQKSEAQPASPSSPQVDIVIDPSGMD